MKLNLSKKEAVILTLLTNQHEMYGWDMVDSSDGLLKKQTIYVQLARLEDKGFIQTSRVEDREAGGRTMPRRYYRITGLGQKVFKLHTEVKTVAGDAVFA